MKVTPDQILSEDRSVQDSAIRHLHQYCLPQLEKMMAGYTINKTEALDIFQDAMAMLYLNLKKGRFNGQASLETYTLAICKNIWLFKLRSARNEQNRYMSLKLEQTKPAPEAIVDINRLSNLITQLGADCQKILRLFYYEKKSMDEITEHFGFSNKQSAKNKKSRCMQRLIKIVQSADMKLSDFFESE